MPTVARKKVVIFGDSLSANGDTPGGAMAAKLRAAGADVRVNARVGRSAWNFYKREDASAQMAEIRAFDPDLVVVVLGTNDIGLNMGADIVKMRELRAELAGGGAKVWAFGPPTFPSSGRGSELQGGGAEVVTMMHAVFGDRLLDLRPITTDFVPAGKNGRALDGVHFTATGGKVLGDRMARHFLAQSAGGLVAPLVLAVAVGWLLWSRRRR